MSTSRRRLAAFLGVGVAAAGSLSAIGLSKQADSSAEPPTASASSVGALAHATWLFRPESLRELAKNTPTAVVATVEVIVPGPPVTAPDDPADSPPPPSQLIAFTTDERWFGDAPNRFTLFKTGSQDEWIEDDAPYEVGAKYVLFVRPRRDDPTLYIPVAPDGRLRVIDETLRAVAEGPVGERLGGLSVGEARRAAKAEKEA